MVFNRGRLVDIYSTVSSTIMKRIQEIADFVFKNSEVKVFDFWKMTELVFDHQKTGEVHPGRGEGSSSWIMPAIRDRFLNLLGDLIN